MVIELYVWICPRIVFQNSIFMEYRVENSVNRLTGAKDNRENIGIAASIGLWNYSRRKKHKTSKNKSLKIKQPKNVPEIF